MPKRTRVVVRGDRAALVEVLRNAADELDALLPGQAAEEYEWALLSESGGVELHFVHDADQGLPVAIIEEED